MEKDERDLLKFAANTMYDYQKLRIAFGNRIKAGNYSDSEHPVFKNHFERFGELESEMLKYIGTLLKDFSIWDWLKGIKGVGPTMACVIISEFDIYEATTVSKMWAFAGLNPGMVFGRKYAEDKDGEKIIVVTEDLIRGDKLTPGFLSPFNTFLRSKLIGVLGPSFLKCNSPYRIFLDNYKNRLESENWGKSKGHRHNASVRYMIKMFLKDLYIAWRNIEGLPVREPYDEEYLNHKH